MILPERLSSLRMYKSLKHQPYSSSAAPIQYSCLIFRGQVPQSQSFVLFLPSFSRFTWPVRVIRLSHCLVEMVSKSFVAFLILALTTSVNSAAIGSARQFFIGLVV